MDTGRKGQKVVAVLSLFSLHFGAFLGIIPFTSDTCALIGIWCLNPAMDKGLKVFETGPGGGNRTPDLRFRRPLLYPLSYSRFLMEKDL